MRLTVIERKCQGHGVCLMAAPELFGIGESDGYSYPLVDEVPAAQQDAARRAVAGCPEQAIETF